MPDNIRPKNSVIRFIQKNSDHLGHFQKIQQMDSFKKTFFPVFT